MMHVHFEESKSRGDCTIQALSWMGRVPDIGTEGEPWRVGDEHPEEGWLASGNIKGTLGITLTATHGSKRRSDSPTRANFNLRGHRSAITMVEWNEPYQKLATCDFSGVIFVWIKHEGRWSIELINDRNIQVTDFAWSHSGRMALIIYRDGFVLVGSVAGQRFWSSMLNLDNAFITCGIWTPDDQKVMFGTSQGHIVVMSATGVMLSQVTILEGSEVTSLAWSCERFTMDALEDVYLDDITLQPQFVDHKEPLRTYMLAAAFKCGKVYLMSGHDDVCPRVVDTGLIGVQMAWSSEGLVLAVGGYRRQPDLSCESELRFYNTDGNLLLATIIPKMSKPLMSLTWGHNDRRLFLGVGCHVVTAWVHKVMPSLEFLCRIQTHTCIQEEEAASRLPLPAKLKHLVSSMFLPTIKGYTPDAHKLREFVCVPPPVGERLYCTMIRHGEERVGGHYTLYLEHLGGMIPLLKGKRVSKIRPEFIIFDPKIRMGDRLNGGEDRTNSSGSERETESEDDHVDGCGSPRMRRRKLARTSHAFVYNRRNSNTSQRSIDDIMFDDDLPESHRLVEVMSNIWGTKFKIQGMSCYLPSDLGSVQYRTSLLHLQPRQMTINLMEMRPDGQGLVVGRGEPAAVVNGLTSESEEESNGILDDQNGAAAAAALDASLPISPEATAKHFPLIARTPGTPGLPSPGFLEPGTSYMVTSPAPSRLGPVPSAPGCHQEPYVALWKHTPSASRQSNYRSHVECDTNSDMLNSNGSHQTLIKTAKSSSSSNPGDNSAGHCQGMVNSCSASVRHAAGSACHSSSLHSHENDMQESTDTAKPSLYQCVLNPHYKENLNSPSSIINTIKYIDDEEDVGVYNQAFQMSGEDLASLCKPTSYADQCKQTNGAEVDSKDLIKPCLNQQDSNGANSDNSLHDDALIRGKHILCANRPKSLTGSLEDMLVLTQHEDDRFQGSSTMSTVELKASSGLTKAIDSMHINKSDGILSGRKTDADPVKSFSLPSSPLHRLLSPKHKKNKDKKETTVSKSKISSPLKQRRLRKYNTVDSSDDEVALNNDDHLTCENYKDLESFQKAQLKQKLRRARSKPERPTEHREPLPPRRKYLIMHNKAPLWNEASQVYQLDFGGRVTQESAKNFQIELQGKQVMQFGRIDSNAYTLDFQQPFCAIQAFAVALANVTQRLK